MCNRSKNGSGGGAWPLRPVILAWERGQWLGSGPIRSLWKLGKLVGYFGKAPGPSQAPDDKIPGNRVLSRAH